MEFGVFDHLDRSCADLHQFYEERLRLVELYERGGVRSYHIAEHHATPLGMAPSPSVFLAAVSQRTRRLRFGPMVYAFPLYHPLRLVEEICMLDQLSGGRLEIGFGRGASVIEASFFGRDPSQLQEIYSEGVDLTLAAIESGRLDFDGRFFNFEDIPIAIEARQKPYPPVWYGVHSIESAKRAARQGFNIISLDNARETRAFVDAYREQWQLDRGDAAPEPCIGIAYFITVAETREAALATARRAYPVWHTSFNHLYKQYGKGPRHQRPSVFDGMAKEGRAIAGTPDDVIAFLNAEAAVAGVNFLVGQFAYGDQTYREVEQTVRLFTEHVMPALSGSMP
jgi:alkanesulfonate monooxygenase SsuD/methylene tetrahydromethanopterin reductase-like flavin-dependent oxidoreductase (luciferase family)